MRCNLESLNRPTNVNDAGDGQHSGLLFVPDLVSLAYETFFVRMSHVGV